MVKKEKNFAYIDGANLYNGSSSLDWKLDYRRFRIWLKDKYSVERAYIFIGLVGKNKEKTPIETKLYQGSFRGLCRFIIID